MSDPDRDKVEAQRKFEKKIAKDQLKREAEVAKPVFENGRSDDGKWAWWLDLTT